MDKASSTTARRPSRGILKYKPPVEDDGTKAQRSSGDSSAHGVQWDEATIAAHDLERGTRMKIEEPKTPYHNAGSQSSDSEHEDNSAHGKPPHELVGLSERLSDLEQRQTSGEAILRVGLGTRKRVVTALSEEDDDNDGESGDEEDPAAMEKRQQFEKRRKMHYNEWKVIKAMRQKQAKILAGEAVSSSESEEDSE